MGPGASAGTGGRTSGGPGRCRWSPGGGAAARVGEGLGPVVAVLDGAGGFVGEGGAELGGSRVIPAPFAGDLGDGPSGLLVGLVLDFRNPLKCSVLDGVRGWRVPSVCCRATAFLMA